FNTLDLVWQGSLASAGGDLVAWAGDTSGFNMACTLSGSACNSSTGTLHESGNATSSSRAGGGRNGSSVREQGVWTKPGGGTGRGNGSSAAQRTCVRTFDAQAPY